MVIRDQLDNCRKFPSYMLTQTILTGLEKMSAIADVSAEEMELRKEVFHSKFLRRLYLCREIIIIA